MKVELLNIDDCFNIKSTPRVSDRFRPTDGPAYDPHIFEEISYHCLKCNYIITFNDSDFKKHRRSNFTNLTQEENYFLNTFIKTKNMEQNSFLDFYCPDCKTPTRIYYIDGIGGKHGQYQVGIESVLIINKE